MKRLKKLVLTVLLVAAQLLLVCWIVDIAFRHYEETSLYHYASKDKATYNLDDFFYNDRKTVLPKKKPAGQFRVLVFGDSFTYAVTQPPHSFCSVLERRLKALGPWKDVRVVNLGFPSISFPQYLEMVYFWTQALEYDAVIFNVYLGNDFNDVRDTPFEPAALRERLAALCAKGLPFGKETLIPHKYPFRFLDAITARFLDEMYGNPRWRRFFSLPPLPTAPAPGPGAQTEAVPGASRTPVASPTPGAPSGPTPGASPTPGAPTGPTPGTPAARADAAPVQVKGQTPPSPPSAADAINPADYRTLCPVTPEEMASEMRSSLRPFVREDLLAYDNNLPWYRLFMAMAAREADRGVPVLVMLSPPQCAVDPAVRARAAADLGVAPEAVDLTLPRRLTLELARQVGLPEADVVDFTPCLAGRTPDGKATYTGVETHWSVAGNAWVGELLAKAVASRWLHRPEAAGAACAQPALPPGQALLGAPAPLDPDTAALAREIVDGCPAEDARK